MNPATALAAAFVLAAAFSTASRAGVIESYAYVNDDATLEVRKRHIRLHGIYVPPGARNCRTTIRPVRCGSQAVLALEFKIRGFVECHPVRRNADGSLNAVCYSRGEDLGAYLISRGWAVARPEAPFEYTVLERIARTRSLGMWSQLPGPFVIQD